LGSSTGFDSWIAAIDTLGVSGVAESKDDFFCERAHRALSQKKSSPQSAMPHFYEGELAN
jgi:hypothetical protein